MLGRLNHVAIVVPDLAAATALYRDTMGATVSEAVDQPAHGVTTVFIELPNTKIELLHPLGENSPVAAFLAKNPSGGMHHVCYEVEDIDAEYARLKDKVELVHELKTMPWGNKTFQFRDPEGTAVSLYMPATDEARKRFASR